MTYLNNHMQELEAFRLTPEYLEARRNWESHHLARSKDISAACAAGYPSEMHYKELSKIDKYHMPLIQKAYQAMWMQ